MLAEDRGGRECGFGGYGASVVASLGASGRGGAGVWPVGGGSQLAAASLPARALSARAAADLRCAAAHKPGSGSAGRPCGAGSLDDLEGVVSARSVATAARAAADVQAL